MSLGVDPRKTVKYLRIFVRMPSLGLYKLLQRVICLAQFVNIVYQLLPHIINKPKHPEHANTESAVAYSFQLLCSGVGL